MEKATRDACPVKADEANRVRPMRNPEVVEADGMRAVKDSDTTSA